jgi:hypothetical protein
MKENLLKFYLWCVLYWAHMDTPELSDMREIAETSQQLLWQ